MKHPRPRQHRRAWHWSGRIIGIKRPARPRARRGAPTLGPTLGPTLRLRRLLCRAEFELSRVQRRELGRVFLSAALFLQRERLQEYAALGSVPLDCEVFSLAEWRALAEGAIEHLEAQDRSKPIVHLLLHMLAGKPEHWASAVLLAGLGARLAPGRVARLSEAQVLSCAGRHGTAQERLGRLMEEDLNAEESWRVLFLLGRCHLAAGRSLFALGAFDAAGELPACAVGALVQALALAQVLGDEARRSRAAARLDLVVGAGDPEFLLALQDLRLRLESGGFQRVSSSVEVLPQSSPAERVLALVGSNIRG